MRTRHAIRPRKRALETGCHVGSCQALKRATTGRRFGADDLQRGKGNLVLRIVRGLAGGFLKRTKHGIHACLITGPA